VAIDEHLRQEIERAGEPADPSGVYEDLIRRKERRRIARWTKAGALALIVVLGSTAGIYGLSRVFGSSSGDAASGPANGLIVYSDIRIDGFDEAGANVIDDWHLYMVDPIDGRVTRIGPDSVDEALYPTWSPDGSRIAFVGFTDSAADEPRSHIYVGDANGSNVKAVFTPADDQQIEGLRWSPDGSRIGYELAEAGPGASAGVSLPGRSWTVWSMTLDGEGHRQVTTTGREMHFSWSPDGARIVFERFEPIQEERELGEAATDLFIVDVESGDEIRLTHDGMSRDPAWSPDGEQIALSHGPRGSQHVALIGADGGGLETLSARAEAGTFFPYGNTIAWSPDGGLIAFSGHSSDDVCSISLLDLRDNSVRTLVSSPASASCPGQEGMSWAPAVEPTGSVSQTPTESPSPEPSPSTDVGEDIGLGFPVCNASSIKGRFASPDANATVFVATKALDVGGCSQPEDAFNVVALDRDQDGLADISYGPIECTLECRTFSAPDVDGDGTDELLLVQDGGAVVGLRLYDFSTNGELAIFPVNVADPGDPQGGFEPSEQAILWLGGDAFELYALQCGDVAAPDGPGVIATAAESLPHDSTDAVWHAHQTTLVLRSDGLLHVVDVRDFTEPVSADPDGPSFRSGETLCGSNLGPPVSMP
jgi:Tol biopolymer transport system component